MIRIEDLTDRDVGRGVVFHYYDGAGERAADIGVLSSWSDTYVFCRFTLGCTAMACDPRQLSWEHDSHD